ncbi:DUF1810 domain-containing protein [Asticcacaulis machinosus]|uniref:DUF1810 domain-containing protein n=1 Tax=Asticcacaulis machinosus TaxID=2984211 RepID=A0ABT5HG29_9CAUL|nr:DUF1810 domain-containing protein [Asticcacaulis machinosus]MDC7675208.1 DUF1810 domain-containing protein [Asticcacaulis machinosus]
MVDDPFRLERFVEAQETVYDQVTSELAAGRKRTHWMWYIFPQLAGLSFSSMATHFGITSLLEAEAYLAHPVLGRRLYESTRLAIEAPAPSLKHLLGSPDDLKFRSSMTLFEVAANSREFIFHEALDKWCSGEADQRTLKILASK